MNYNELRNLVRDLLTEKQTPKGEKVTSGWVSWPAAVLDEPYEGSAKSGIGPGERRLAKLWKGKIYGAGVSMDVLAADGSKWEVKAPGSRTSGELRIEQEGIRLMEPHYDAIKNVVKALIRVFSPNFEYAQAVLNVFSSEQLSYVRSFLFEPGQGRSGKSTLPPAQDILRGELSDGRSKALSDVLKIVSLGLHVDYKKKRDVKQKYLDKYTQIRDLTKRYGDKSAPTVVKKGSYEAHVVLGVAKLLDIDPEVVMRTIGEFGVSANNVVETHLMSSLPPELLPAFVDPVAFMEEHWTKMITPSELFSSLSGVVLVDENGYRVIGLDDVDRCLAFGRVSKGSPYLKVVA
jgi:hypothetical protein